MSSFSATMESWKGPGFPVLYLVDRNRPGFPEVDRAFLLRTRHLKAGKRRDFPQVDAILRTSHLNFPSGHPMM